MKRMPMPGSWSASTPGGDGSPSRFTHFTSPRVAFVVGLFAAACGAHLAVCVVTRARAGASPADRARLDAHPGTLLVIYAQAVARAWLLLGVPLVCALVNALRVKNCDLGGGLLW